MVGGEQDIDNLNFENINRIDFKKFKTQLKPVISKSDKFDLETAKLCNRYQIPYMSGCMTITEIVTAMEAGVDIIKVFPGNAFGPSFIKAIKGPLPQVNLMPTGGVNLDNVDQWIKNGCVAVGVGSDLTAPAKKGDYAGVTELAKQFVAKVQAARGK